MLNYLPHFLFVCAVAVNVAACVYAMFGRLERADRLAIVMLVLFALAGFSAAHIHFKNPF